MPKKSRRTRCEAVAREVDIPRPFDLDAFCAHIAAQRGRPLRLVPLEGVPDAATPCGVWVATHSADLIFYEPATSSVHKLHIVLHEVAHLLLGHGAPDREHPGYVTRLLSGGQEPLADRTDLDDLDELDLDQLLHILGRTSYTDGQERDAELLATILSDRALSADSPAASTDEATRVLDRLNDAFGHPVRG